MCVCANEFALAGSKRQDFHANYTETIGLLIRPQISQWGCVRLDVCKCVCV